MVKKTVLILAGGQGTRVKKYYPNLIKPLIPVNGVPIIERQIKLFRDYTIYINCNEEDAPKLRYLHLPLLTEKMRIGNAGVLLQYKKELGEKFIVIYCDELTDLNPDDLWEAHDKNSAVMTITIKNIRRKHEFGLVITASDRISTITKDRYVDCGIFVADKRLFHYIKENKIQDFNKDIFPTLIQHGLLTYYTHKGYWADIGTEFFLRKSKIKEVK